MVPEKISSNSSEKLGFIFKKSSSRIKFPSPRERPKYKKARSLLPSRFFRVKYPAEHDLNLKGVQEAQPPGWQTLAALKSISSLSN